MAKKNKSHKVRVATEPQRNLTQGTPKQEPREPAKLTSSQADEEVSAVPVVSDQQKEVDRLEKLYKDAKAKLTGTKRRQVGSKKLEKAKTYATDVTEWALSAKDKSDKATKRCLEAIAKLDDYEADLGIDEEKRLAFKLAEQSAMLVDESQLVENADNN